MATAARAMKQATCVDCGSVRMVRDYSEAKRCQPCARKRWLRSEHARKREAEFGALGAPPEIQAMRMEIISLGRDIAQLTEKLEATYKRNGWPL